uniref:Alpha-carbonic anhydrase domain-containing protein n=1 Tax=Neogobius melanostomus TaxID=47308 RepID=A0A8C6ULV8_9GOBI
IQMHIVMKKKDSTLNGALASGSGSAGILCGGNVYKQQYVIFLGAQVNFTSEVSLDDLLGDVNRDSCNEAVVWTVFKHSITVDHTLMLMFPTEMDYHDVYRPAQSLHNRTITYRSVASAPNIPTVLVLLLTASCIFLWN